MRMIIMDTEKLIEVLKNTKGITQIDETQIIDCTQRFRTKNELRIQANEITIFYDAITYIEIFENSIGFRTETEDGTQTNYTIFYFSDLEELEIEINNHYHYF